MTQFERVYREYFSDVYAYILKLSGSADTAEEITSETFFKALNAIDGFRGDCSLKTWLCGIAKNAFLSERRRTQPEPLDEQPERADEGATPEAMALEKDESRRLHRLLHELPEPYKEVFSLRVFGQLGFRDIGELFGKTENWACVVYHRARRKIQEKWEE